MVGNFRIMGLDLGQASDYAAAAILDKRTYPEDFTGPQDQQLRCVALRRWELGTDYNQIVHDVIDVNVDVVVVDFTGVGRPVVDMLRAEARRRHYAGRIRPVTITASSARTKLKSEERGTHWVVPKIDLVSSIVLLQQKDLLRLPRVPEVKQLMKELQDFRMKFTKAANIQLGAEKQHDDLVIALGLACWWTQRFGVRKLAVL